MKLTQKNFDDFVMALNHRMTRIEKNVAEMRIDGRWMKRVGYYMATVLTGILVKSIWF